MEDKEDDYIFDFQDFEDEINYLQQQYDIYIER